MHNRMLALCAAVVLLAAGMGLGRYATLRQGAVLRGSAPGAGVVALAARQAEPPETDGREALWQVNINRAGEAELSELPGIGPAIAGRIVSYRAENGDFQSLEEIMAVRGIGEGIFAKIRDYITLDITQ